MFLFDLISNQVEAIDPEAIEYVGSLYKSHDSIRKEFASYICKTYLFPNHEAKQYLTRNGFCEKMHSHKDFLVSPSMLRDEFNKFVEQNSAKRITSIKDRSISARKTAKRNNRRMEESFDNGFNGQNYSEGVDELEESKDMPVRKAQRYASKPSKAINRAPSAQEFASKYGK